MVYAKRIDTNTGNLLGLYTYPVELKRNLDEERGYIQINEEEYLSLKEDFLNREKPIKINPNHAERDEVIDIENDD